MSEHDNNDELVARTPAVLLEQAIHEDLDIEKLQKIMDLQERWEVKEAKKAFLQAMSKFQAECPELEKSKAVSFGQGKTSYKYIPLGEIRKQIKAVLKDCGLSYRWETDQGDNGITVTCVVSHVAGHSESNKMTGEKDSSGSKNPIQSIGSTMTYLQRYTLIGALGISTADQDVDGQQPAAPKVELTDDQSAALLKKAKDHIDTFDNAEILEAAARPYLKQMREEGIHDLDRALLSEYITNQYQTLKQ